MIPGSANPLLLKSAAAAAGGYQVSRSLRFNSSDSGFLSRTPASAGNRKTWTWAGWVKRAALGSTQMLFGTTGTTDATYSEIFFTPADKLEVALGYTSVARIRTTQVFRDPSAWQHIVVAYDNTQATASNRLRLYVNGSEVTAFDTDTRSTFSNTDLGINSTQTHYIGIGPNSGSNYLSAYLADLHLIDGQQLTPSSFTEVSATTGQLIPKAYTGSFGTNGFWLKFSDNSAATAAALGNDYSGNNNDWTPNNLSVTAGAGNDSLVDTPTSTGTDTGVGNEVRGNYCTLNPLDNGGVVLSNGNLDVSNGAAHEAVRTTIKLPSTGKWYAELQHVSFLDSSTSFAFGVDYSNGSTPASWNSSNVIWINVDLNNLFIKINNTILSYVAQTTQGALLQIAYDADTQKLWLGCNNVWRDSSFGTSGNPSAGTNQTVSSVSNGFLTVNSYQATGSVNFGQRAFAYTAPSGFKALCDTNLSPPLVALPNTVMDVKLYTGNGSTQTISGLNFSPDFVWIKGRSGATDHALYDAVRGVQKDLVSNSTAAETTQTTGLTAFNSGGFDLGSLAKLNTSSATYAAWTWDAGSSTVTNTQGSITSQVRANVSAGFSVVTYTGNGGSNVSVGHGLGVAPVLLIVKSRSTSGDWDVTYTFGDGSYDFMSLNTTAAKLDITGRNAPTSTLFYVNGGLSNVNATTYVCYAFTPVVGYSSMGSYVGNGSSDGPFVFTGMRPRWVMVKRTDSAEQWYINDAARDDYNVTGKSLRAQSSGAEASTGGSNSSTWDILSNGFKLRDAGAGSNASGGTYIFAAFAENPFQYARAR